MIIRNHTHRELVLYVGNKEQEEPEAYATLEHGQEEEINDYAFDLVVINEV